MFVRGGTKVRMKTSLALVLAVAGLHISASYAFARTCEISLRLDDSVTLGALQLKIDYSAADGSWLPVASGIDCHTDAPNTLAIFVDDAVERSVTASLVSLAGFSGPRKLAHCAFDDPSAAAVPAAFLVIVDEASNVAGKVLSRKPRISVSMPDCGPDAPTTTTTTITTTTTTTTTLAPTTTVPPPPTSTTTTSTSTTTTTITTTSTTSTTLVPCGNGIVDGDEECDDGNTADGDGCDAGCTADVLCGDANGNDTISTGDALLVLRAAIGQSVTCPTSRCDVDGDAKVRAADSLRVLKRAVGQSVVMHCPIG
jgi:cysteine-rich repeat protein